MAEPYDRHTPLPDRPAEGETFWHGSPSLLYDADGFVATAAMAVLVREMPPR